MEHTFKTFGTMLDCSRNAVMTAESVKRWIDLTAKLGCNTLHLYMEDTYEVDGQPYFGHLRGRYSKAELKQIDAYAAAHGMQVILCIQTLAHVNALFHWPVYREIRDAADILLTGDERTYALVDGMFRTLRECLRTNIVNIGMDEADLLGLGQYLTLHGYRDRFSILMEHLRKVSEMAKKIWLRASDVGRYVLPSGGRGLLYQFQSRPEARRNSGGSQTAGAGEYSPGVLGLF